MTTNHITNTSEDIAILINHWNAVVAESKKSNLITLSINEEAMIAEVLAIEENFRKNRAEFHKEGKKIKSIIVGEATQSLENFIYNAEGVPHNVFLVNELLTAAEKKLSAEERAEKLREKLRDNGILVLDLYLLPLPTFMYNEYLPKSEDPIWKECTQIYEKYWAEKLSGFRYENEVNVYVGFKKLRRKSVFTHFKVWIQNSLEGVTVNGLAKGNDAVPYYGDHIKDLFV